VSRGLGRVERFVLDHLEGGRVYDGLAYSIHVAAGKEWELWTLASLYAHDQGIEYDDDAVRTVRRAIRSLERKGIADTRRVYRCGGATSRRERQRQTTAVRLAGQSNFTEAAWSAHPPPRRHGA
jgi:hypothetical protein